jgi:hypothetical protein
MVVAMLMVSAVVEMMGMTFHSRKVMFPAIFPLVVLQFVVLGALIGLGFPKLDDLVGVLRALLGITLLSLARRKRL